MISGVPKKPRVSPQAVVEQLGRVLIIRIAGGRVSIYYRTCRLIQVQTHRSKDQRLGLLKYNLY